MTERSEVPANVIDKLRSVCLGLPEAYEEQAWVGTRWRVRQRTFAHVLVLDVVATGVRPGRRHRRPGVPVDVPVVGRRSCGARAIGPPFFKPPWRPTVVGLILDAGVDWDEVTELLTESYCVLAPKTLVRSRGSAASASHAVTCIR